MFIKIRLLLTLSMLEGKEQDKNEFDKEESQLFDK